MIRELDVVTDWVEIPITFRSICYECGKVLPGPAFWSKSKKSTKHLGCGKVDSEIINKTRLILRQIFLASNRSVNKSDSIELKCLVCGKMAGCRECSFSSTCNRIVAQLYVCEICPNSNDKEEGAFKNYQQVFIRKAFG